MGIPTKKPAYDAQRDGTIVDMGESLKLRYCLLSCLINLQLSGERQTTTIRVNGRMYQIEGQVEPYEVRVRPVDN